MNILDQMLDFKKQLNELVAKADPKIKKAVQSEMDKMNKAVNETTKKINEHSSRKQS